MGDGMEHIDLPSPSIIKVSNSGHNIFMLIPISIPLQIFLVPYFFTYSIAIGSILKVCSVRYSRMNFDVGLVYTYHKGLFTISQFSEISTHFAGIFSTKVYR